MLQWYYTNVTQDPNVLAAIQKYLTYLLDPQQSWDYGVNSLPLVTGFVGMVVADLLQPWCTFSPV